MRNTHRITTTAAVLLSLATAGFMLAMLGLGAALLISQRRPGQAPRTTALPS